MLKIFTRLAFILFLIAVSLPQNTVASHITGSDISYRCLGGNLYEVVVTIYRDCDGIGASSSITIDIESPCGNQTLTLEQDSVTSGLDVSQLCSPDSSTCQNGSLPGVELYTYRDTITLQPDCGLYTFSYEECCRNTSNNILNSTSAGYAVVATWNSDTVTCGSAPVFTSLPVPYFCLNQPVNYSHGAIDVDGDSLVYSLIPPLDVVGTNVTYTGTYSATNPLPTSGGFGFDPQTGQMTFTPTQQGVYVVAVLVREYRNGILIGTTMRDIQIIAINCSNTAPSVNANLADSSVTGGVLTDYNSMGVCPGENLTFTIGARDVNGQAIRVSSNIAASIPGATLDTTYVGGLDSVIVTFSWTPSGLDTGFRYFTIQFEDNACPITGVQLFTYDITVLDGIYAGPDKFYCTGGGPVQVNVSGGNQFSWSSTFGMVSANPDSSIVFLAPSDTTDYIVRSDLAGGCKNIDTVRIFNVNSFTTDITSPDDTICLNSSTTMTVTASPSSEGPFTYSWGPMNQGVLNLTSQTTSVRPGGSTMYQVTVLSASRCAIRDSFPIVIQGVGPKVNIRPSADYVCPGADVTLSAIVSALGCGGNSDPLNPCLPNSTFALQDLGTGAVNGSTNTTPYIGFFDDGRVQYLYRASELQGLGLGSGTFTDLGFNVSTKLSTQPYNNFTIKMACTSLNQLSTSFETSGFTTVLNPQPYTTVVGWNTHTLDVPYNWDGFSNLIIEICFDNSNYTRYDNVFYTATSFPGSVLWDNGDLATASGCTALTDPTNGRNRPNTRFIMCKAPLSNYSFDWTGSNGSVLPDSSAPVVQVNSDVTYTLEVSDGTCQGDTFVTVHVDTAVLITLGNDTVICNADTIQLQAALRHPVALTCSPTYVISSVPYLPIVPTGTTGNGPTSDDAVVSGTLPFPFKFFCNTVSQYFICSNGWMSFSTGQGTAYTPQALPNGGIPNNLVALAWADLYPPNGGTIDYFVTGTAPNRVFVSRWNNVAYLGLTGSVNGQIQLYETTNVIEVHLSSVGSNVVSALGMENSNGTVAYSPPGYNQAIFTVPSPIAFRFTPQSFGNSLTNIVWTPNIGISNDTIFNPLVFPDTTTTYVIRSTFANGCTTHDTINVSLGTFNYSLTVSPDSICSGDSVQLQFTGAGVSYLWTPDSSLSSSSVQSPYASPTVTTTYRVVASDSVGCTVHDTLKVNVRTHAPISLGNDRTVCSYDSVILTPSGGSYISYAWSTGATSGSISTSAQTSTSQDYSVRVNDGYCFFNSDTVTIFESGSIPVGVQPAGDTAVCLGESMVLTAPAGFITYQWSTGAQTQSITVSVAGTYFYMAIDTNGCILNSKDSLVLSSVQPPSAAILATDTVICRDQTTAILYVNAVNGIDYTWNPGGVVNDSLLVSAAGTYDLTASDNGCNSYNSFTITDTKAPVVDLGEDQNVCTCTGAALSSNISGNYIWSTAETTQSITALQSGTYSVTVTDNNECTAADAADVDVHCLTVDASVSDPATAIVFIGRDAVLDAATSYDGTFNYMWTPATYLDDSTSRQPNVIAPQTSTGYTVFVTDQINGCTAFDTVQLTVIPQGIPPIPNAFSPNGDGRNDRFGPVIPQALSEVYSIVQMRIYNRWGQMLYDGNGSWDGTFKGAKQMPATYMYYITLEGPDQNNPSVNIQYNLNGSFTLLQ